MRGLVPLLLAALVAGCSSGQSRNPFSSGSTAQSSIRIAIQNQNFNEATVRSLSRTERRLGTVPGNGRASFTLDWPTINDLAIQIDILAGDRFTTNRLSVRPGETVYLTIESPVQRSRIYR